jgi:hypothetical protein
MLRARPAATLEELWQKLEDYGQGNRVHSFLADYAAGNAEILRISLQKRGCKAAPSGERNVKGARRWRRQQQTWLSGVVNGLIRLQQPSAKIPLTQIIPHAIAC